MPLLPSPVPNFAGCPSEPLVPVCCPRPSLLPSSQFVALVPVCRACNKSVAFAPVCTAVQYTALTPVYHTSMELQPSELKFVQRKSSFEIVQWEPFLAHWYFNLLRVGRVSVATRRFVQAQLYRGS
jgi:hypothetical protein